MRTYAQLLDGTATSTASLNKNSQFRVRPFSAKIARLVHESHERLEFLRASGHEDLLERLPADRVAFAVRSCRNLDFPIDLRNIIGT